MYHSKSTQGKKTSENRSQIGASKKTPSQKLHFEGSLKITR